MRRDRNNISKGQGVSILMPAFNAHRFIAGAIRSVLSLHHQEWELLVVSDDGEDYEWVIQRHGIRDSRIRHCRTEHAGSGPGVARNTGQEQAAYDIITNLDADDGVSANYLDDLLPAALEYGAATPGLMIIDAESKTPLPVDLPPGEGVSQLHLRDIVRYQFAYAAIAYDRKRCPISWPELHYGEDILFWLQLLDILPFIAYVPRSTYYYHYQDRSLSRRRDDRTYWIYQRRNLMIQWLRDNQRRVVKKGNYAMMLGWLKSCNEMEQHFGYRLVDTGVFIAENNRRFDAIFHHGDAAYNLSYC